MFPTTGCAVSISDRELRLPHAGCGLVENFTKLQCYRGRSQEVNEPSVTGGQ